VDVLEIESSNLLKKYLKIKDEEDNADEEIEFTKTNKRNIKQGDIWLLGNHRLGCGNSLDEKHMAKLMNDKKADMIFTDPPYNINVSNSSNGMTIQNDNLDNETFDRFLDQSFKMIKKHSNREIPNYICCNIKCHSVFERITDPLRNLTLNIFRIISLQRDYPKDI
jgi:DNA modification methylase